MRQRPFPNQPLVEVYPAPEAVARRRVEVCRDTGQTTWIVMVIVSVVSGFILQGVVLMVALVWKV